MIKTKFFAIREDICAFMNEGEKTYLQVLNEGHGYSLFYKDHEVMPSLAQLEASKIVIDAPKKEVKNKASKTKHISKVKHNDISKN